MIALAIMELIMLATGLWAGLRLSCDTLLLYSCRYWSPVLVPTIYSLLL